MRLDSILLMSLCWSCVATAGSKRQPAAGAAPSPPPDDTSASDPLQIAFAIAVAFVAWLAASRGRSSTWDADVFKALFSELAEGRVIKGVTVISASSFLRKVQDSPRALELLAALSGESGPGHTLLQPPEPAADDELIARDGNEQPPPQHSSRLRALVSEIDTDSDGVITWSEWSRFVGKRLISLAAKLFARCVAKKSPQSSEPTGVKKESAVPAAEFAAQLKRDTRLLQLFNLSGSSTRALVDRLDANGDGEVTWDEFKAAVHEARGS